MSVVALTLRTWLRYVVPLSVLALVALAPVAYLGWRAGAPADLAAARVQIRVTWVLAGCAAALQLLLVAGVAPSVRAVASGSPLPQWRALVDGVRGLVRGALPWLVAITAVLIGGVALAVPGALLAVLVSLTGASEEIRTSPRAAIADSIAIVRAQLPRIALLVLAIVVLDLAITFATQTALVPAITKKATAAKLVPIQTFVRVAALALVAISPLPACALAAAYSHAKRR